MNKVMVYSFKEFMDECKDEFLVNNDHDNDDDSSLDDHEISLHPLNNQVGGHTRLLLLNPTTICKPLNYRELTFYQNIPEDIQLFVPKFKGVIQASYSNSEIQLDNRYSPSFSNESRTKPTKRKRDDLFRMKVHKNRNIREIMKSISLSDQSSKQYFLMLENVTSKFQKANILDLKMGTRQYCDDASQEKKTKQMAKCAATTSATLGVRLCGMQVFQANEQFYFKRDKYWGRQLNEQGLKYALTKFFHDGTSLRVAIIDEFLNKLNQLRSIIEKQSSFRFYSCSLLIVYEGNNTEKINDNDDTFDVEDSNDSVSAEHELNMERIHSDFVPISEETVFLNSDPISSQNEKRRCSFPNDQQSSWILCSNTSSSSSDEYSCRSPHNKDESFEFQHTMKGNRYPIDFDNEPCRKTEQKKSFQGEELKHKRKSNRPKSSVELRIIDFANATFKMKESAGNSIPTTNNLHNGPDGGFITGLDSLKRLLNEILTEV